MTGIPKPIDYDMVYELAKMQAYQREIAAVLRCSLSHLEHDKEFQRVFAEGREAGKMSLRRAQWDMANAGSVPMLIWLGKQYLDQVDRKEITGKDGSPVFQNMTDEELAKRTAQLIEADKLAKITKIRLQTASEKP